MALLCSIPLRRTLPILFSQQGCKDRKGWETEQSDFVSSRRPPEEGSVYSFPEAMLQLHTNMLLLKRTGSVRSQRSRTPETEISVFAIFVALL